VTVEDGERMVAMGNALQNVIVIDGQIVGTWRRTVKSSSVFLELNAFKLLKEAEGKATTLAAGWYGKFLGLPVFIL
jgi:hypothetical protein